MARATAVEGLGEIRAARGHDGAAKFFFDAIAEESLLASQGNRRLELAVGKMFEPFHAAGDADVFFDEIVVGLNVLVTERPVFAVAVERSSFKVPVAEAQADAAPDIGAATGNAQAAHPIERLFLGRGVGLLEIVDEPVKGVFVADVELGLDGASLADDFRSHVAVLEFERGLVLGKILVGLGAAGFEECNFQPRFGEAFAGPAAGSAGTYDDHVVGMMGLVGHTVSAKAAC